MVSPLPQHLTDWPPRSLALAASFWSSSAKRFLAPGNAGLTANAGLIANENGYLFIVDLPTENGDFPYFG